MRQAHEFSLLSLLYAMVSLWSHFLGLRSIPKLYYASKTALVQLRSSLNKTDTEEMSLEEFVEKRCPSLHNAFSQAWWLPG